MITWSKRLISIRTACEPRAMRQFLAACLGVVLCATTMARLAIADDIKGSGENGRLTTEEAKKLKNPVPYTKASIARGRLMYIRECTECHGMDGKSQVDVIANATDLTEPKFWKSGTSDGEIFRSIRDGAGDAMPPFSEKFEKAEDEWHLVNFLRSLWPDDKRPKLQDANP